LVESFLLTKQEDRKQNSLYWFYLVFSYLLILLSTIDSMFVCYILINSRIFMILLCVLSKKQQNTKRNEVFNCLKKVINYLLSMLTPKHVLTNKK